MNTNGNRLDIIPKPQCPMYRMNKRELVKFSRRRSAYELALINSKDGNVYFADYDKAYALLNRIQRYALAHERQCTRENTNESYANSAQCAQDEKRLLQRFIELKRELGNYGLTLIHYWLYPTIVDAEKREKYFLHYYD